MDTSSSFKSELAGYRKQLARPYLTDQSAEDELVKEAYERMKYEVNASNILISLDANANPQDTLAAFNKINDLRSSIVNGQNFSDVAKTHPTTLQQKRTAEILVIFQRLEWYILLNPWHLIPPLEEYRSHLEHSLAITSLK